MDVSQDIFRAYDIRGVYGTELNAEIGEQVGLVFGNYLRKAHSSGTISIGCDARISSPELQEAVSKGISNSGFDVDVIGMVPIPVANFYTWKASLSENPYLAGVYITASHNPAEYNGIRFRHPDGAGYTEGNIEIKRMFFEERAVTHPESGKINILSTEEVLSEYADFVKSKMGVLDGMRIAIDPGNGVGSIIIDELFQKFGVETTCINNEPDGRFPNRPSEPAPKNLGDLISMSKVESFDFSVA